LFCIVDFNYQEGTSELTYCILSDNHDFGLAVPLTGLVRKWIACCYRIDL